jgi:hypothetical protein
MQSCGSWGSLACAATAARLLKLDKSSTRNALGLAEFYAPGSPMLRSVREPSMAKSAISAGAMTGVQVAQQAAAGHTSITSLLADPKYDSWMRQIGRVFLLPSGIEWKPWGACAWGQPAVGAAYRLVVEHRIRLDRIEAIHIRTFDKANELYQGPVSTPEEAQYNIKWPLAALLVHGQVGPNQTLPHQFSDPRVLELYGRIFIHRDQEAEAAFRRFDTDCGGTDGVFGGGSAEIRLKNDGVFINPIANSAGLRWDRGVVEGKFCWLSGYRLDASQIGSLIHLVGTIETLDTIKPLLDHLRFPAAKPSNRLTPPPASASLEYSPPPPEWFLQLMRLNGYQ